MGNTYPPHELAGMFPLMTGGAFHGLVKSIRENGLLQPITLLGGQVLDGRNRLAACEAAGVEPRFVEYSAECDPLDWVLAQNRDRRHLTINQLHAITAEYVPKYKERARERQERLGRELGGNPNKTLPACAQEGSAEESGEATALAAKAAGIGQRGVADGYKLLKEAPDLHAEVKAGTTKLADAMRTLAARKAAAAPPAGETPEGPFRAKAVTAARREKIRALYTAGYSYEAIAAEVGMAKGSVITVVSQLGIGARSRIAVETRNKRIVEMAERGYHPEQIAREVGTTSHAVSLILKAAGLAPASERMGRSFRVDPNQMMAQLVAASAVPQSLTDLIDGTWEQLDRTRFAEWAAGLSEAITALTNVRNRLKKEIMQ